MRTTIFDSSITRLLVICGMALLVGCAGSSGGAGSERHPADFDDATVKLTNMPEGYVRMGRFTGPEAVGQMVPGMSQYDVRGLLGEPDQIRQHWWFYNINLHLDEADDYLVCQYRVAFDERGLVSNGEWRRPQCKDRYEALSQPDVQEITLSSDVLFAFDSTELTSAGTRELDTVASVVSSRIELDRVVVVGHADRIGKEAYNQVLSVRRAEAVRDYLISKGVSGRLILSEGRGAKEPLVVCESSKIDASLKNCLQPNRRVHITIHGQR